MGLAIRWILVLFSVSFVFLLFNFEMLKVTLHLASQYMEVDVAAEIHDADFGLPSRFRMMLGMNHHRPRHRRHQRSSEAPALAPAPAPIPAHEATSATLAPLFHEPRKVMPPSHRSHITPARIPAHKLREGGHTRLPKSAIVGLAVVGLFLVLGVAISALLLRRSRKFPKDCKKAFKLCFNGSRDQRSPATRKVSSLPSPDPLYLVPTVQYQENYPNLKQSSECKSLSILSTTPTSTELIVSDHTVDHNSQSDEVESFHSIPSDDSSTGFITELPLDPSQSSPQMTDLPSDSSYQSISPDRSHFSPKGLTFSASSHFSLCNTSRCTEISDVEETEVNHQKIVKSNGISGSMEHHEASMGKRINSKFRNPSSEYNHPPSYHMDTSPSTINKAFTVSNTKVKLTSKEPSRCSKGAILQTLSAVPKSPPPPPPKQNLPVSLKGQHYSPPPPPPPIPLPMQVGKDGSTLPRLKPLHWDKVRATPNRSMVWNDIRSSSFEFEFDEQMIKSLFAYNFHGPVKDEEAMSKTASTTKHVIEHHRLQNTTILLKTLNASTEQVCISITQGTGLSVQQLEALIKMKPTKEEEEKLMNCDGDINMLDPAENFVKVVLTIPMAFPRIEVMLYKETFDDEIAHIKMSFTMITGACTELRSSKLFLRLLEAVLKTGNRMNVGTLKGGASAFKLDALLKLADIRGADGKTTLLNFVVQEMTRSRGLKASKKLNETPISSHTTLTEQEEYSVMGIEFVSELSNELGNVKKVASIDLDTLINSISNLSCGLVQLRNIVENDLPNDDQNKNFLQCMRSFLNYAENTMQELKVGEAQVLLNVRETTEYYHGEISKDETNPLHIFVIMKDFLGLLDRVCREMRGSKHNQPLNLVFPLR